MKSPSQPAAGKRTKTPAGIDDKDTDVVKKAVMVFERVAKKNGRTVDRPALEADLRAFVAELHVAQPIKPASKELLAEYRAVTGKPDAPLVPFQNPRGTVGIGEARELLTDAEQSFLKAEKRLTTLAARTVGLWPEWGPMGFPHDEIARVKLYLTRMRIGIAKAVEDAGNPRGGSGNLVDRADGTPIHLFLARLIHLWSEQTGRKRRGVDFNDIATNLIFAMTGVEIDDLKQEIKKAKRLEVRAPYNRAAYNRAAYIIKNAPGVAGRSSKLSTRNSSNK